MLASLSSVDYGVLAGYMVLMLAVGYICRNISKNLSDYVRMGCKSTWWLMGLSLFMASFSAATFTGLCAQSFLGGWSGMVTTWSAAAGLLIQGWLFAPWMRRLRPITPGDIVRLRFGRTVEQIFVYVGALSPLVWGGFMLLGLSKFTAIIFDVNVYYVILFAGVVVIIYSVSGGSWSVQITDNLQAFILIPVTIVVALLSLQAIGGLDGLFNEIEKQNLQDEFKIIKEDRYKYSDVQQTVNVRVSEEQEKKIIAAHAREEKILALMQKVVGVEPVAAAYTEAMAPTTQPAPSKAASSKAVVASMPATASAPALASAPAEDTAKKAALTKLITTTLELEPGKRVVKPDDIKKNKEGQKYYKDERKVEISKLVAPGYHTLPWLIALVITGIIGTANPTMAYRYLSAKDEKAGRNAAWLAGILMLLGSLVWFIPPMVGRLLFADDIFGAQVKNPGEVAYAMVAQKVLPPGVLGLVLIAMFSASMSSMDSNLTGTAGLITNNIYPPLCRLFKWKEWTGKKLLHLTQAFNLMLGIWAMTAACLMEKYGSSAGLFEYMFKVMVLVGAPIGTPFLLAFFVKKLPPWGPLVGTAFGLVLSAFLMFHNQLFGLLDSWGLPQVGQYYKEHLAFVDLLHHQMWIMPVWILIPTLLTCFWWKTTTKDFRENHVGEFFRRMRTPIDFEKEVGKAADTQQLKLVGGLGMIMGLMILPLVFWAKNADGGLDWPGIWSIVFVGGFVIAICALLYFVGVRGSHSAEMDTDEISEEPEYGVAFAHSDEAHPPQIEDETTHSSE